MYRSELREQPVEEQRGPVIQGRCHRGVVDTQQVPQDLASLVVRKMHKPGCELRQH